MKRLIITYKSKKEKERNNVHRELLQGRHGMDGLLPEKCQYRFLGPGQRWQDDDALHALE